MSRWEKFLNHLPLRMHADGMDHVAGGIRKIETTADSIDRKVPVRYVLGRWID
jgi:hypothetical protein